MTDQETLKRISRSLRNLRGDLSLAEVARRAGSYPTTIKEIEEGVRMPGVGLLTRIAEALDSNVSEILSGKAQKKSLEPVA